MKKPKAPDPAELARTQAGYNMDTALAQQSMNMIGQSNPWGSVSYDQSGTRTIIGSDGRAIEVPNYTANVTLSPEQQAIFDRTQAAEGNLAQLAQNQSSSLIDLLSNPFEYTNRDAENWAMDLASPRLMEQQGNANQALRSQLINSGIREGSQAWESAMNRQGYLNNDQWNQLALQGRQMGFNEALATRNQPINEMTALLGATQIENPAQMGAQTPQTQLQGVDYSGLAMQNYQNQMNAYGGMMGGLFGSIGSLGSAAIMASDRRVKKNIERVGELDNGLTVYAYEYIWGGPRQIGLMAQEVEELHPHAVHEDSSGIKGVDYGEAVK